MDNLRVRFLVSCSSLLAFVFALSVAAAPLAPVGSKTYIAKPTKLWTEPNRFGEAVVELKAGLPVEVLDYDASRSWLLVRTPGGREGWLPLRFTSQNTRRSQPLISHKKEILDADADRSPASSFEETVEADEKAATAEEKAAAKKGAVVKGPAGKTFPMEFSLGVSNQLSVEKAWGFSFGAAAMFEIDSTLFWGAGLGWKRHSKSVTGTCFTTDECTVSRSAHRFYPHALIELRKSGFLAAANLGLAVDRSSITTRNNTTGVVEVDDGNGNKLTGSGTEFRLGFGLRLGYSFEVSPTMAIGPYLDYDLDLSMSDGSGEFAGDPTSKLSHLFGGGVIMQIGF